MKKSLLLLPLLLSLFLLNLAPASAQTAKAGTDSALLYEISGQDLKRPSYLFGTIHLICEKDMFPAEKLKSYLGQTEQLMLEVNLDDPAEMQKAVKGWMLPDNRTMKDHLTPEQYAKVDQVFNSYLGVSYDRFQTFSPVFAATVLLTSPKVLGCQPPTAYDLFLMQTAKAAKVPILGLESVDTEFAALAAQPFDKQIESLNKIAAEPEKSFDDFRHQYQLYLAQDSDGLYTITAKAFKEDGGSQVKLLDERNANWIPVIEKNIALKPSFIAVGGGHLGGDKGVISLLRAKGYQVKSLRL